MTDSAIATDIHKALDVHLDRRTEFTLDLVLLVDLSADLGNLTVVPVTNLDGRIDAALLEDSLSRRASDTEDIGKTYLSLFVVR